MDALLVLRASPYHQSWSIDKIETYIIAAIKNDRLRVIYDNQNRPFGVFTWTYLSPDRESRYMDNPSSLLASDFESNDGTLWAIDFAAPFGYCRDVVRALRREFPKGTKFRIYRTAQKRFGWMIA
jgi:hemolysin-activating ACP:hemolysin acyltransferase